jgi:hypothetical protein
MAPTLHADSQFKVTGWKLFDNKQKFVKSVLYFREVVVFRCIHKIAKSDY